MKIAPADRQAFLASACYQAREGLARKDASLAAYGLRQLTSLVIVDWAHASTQGKSRLEVPLAAFSAAGRAVESGVVTALVAFDRTVTQLHIALAWHECERAHQALYNAEYLRLAETLVAATHHVRSAVAWADDRLDDESAVAVADAWTIAQSLRHPDRPSFCETQLRLERLTTTIKTLATQLAPRACRS